MRFKTAHMMTCVLAIAFASGCTSVADEPSSARSLAGAWASGEDISACETAPITYFSSDGVVLILLAADGPVHSVGSWTVIGDKMQMTHNDFPLDPSGLSNDPVVLNITRLDALRFDTRNAKGDERLRVRCPEILIQPENHADGHA